jgi:glycosyltransferase involved in cell wall biosynthesis
MNIPPTVSVVMSVYNSARYLARSIESILTQDGVTFEFIIINDGSTDNSRDILARYAAQDQRIRVIDQENAGLTRALIRGCKEARGTYIARQDSDDVSLRGRLSRLAEMLRADDGLTFVSSWADVIGPEDEPLLTQTRPDDSKAATNQLLVERIGPPGHGSVMFRRTCYEIVGGYRSQFYYAQDSDLWLRLGSVGRLGYAQEVLYQYRVSEESISGALHSHKLPFARLIDELHVARMAGHSEEAILSKAPVAIPRGQKDKASEARTLYFIGRCLFTRRDRRASTYLRQCLRLTPYKFKAWALLLGVALWATKTDNGSK